VEKQREVSRDVSPEPVFSKIKQHVIQSATYFDRRVSIQFRTVRRRKAVS
jgi:hypothetical protein